MQRAGEAMNSVAAVLYTGVLWHLFYRVQVDLRIRRETNGRKSLQDLFRLL